LKKDPASEVPSSGPNGVLPQAVADNDSIALSKLIARVAYTVRFKSVRGIEVVQVTASTPDRAKDVAKAYVNSTPGRIFLSINPTYVADERILATHLPNPKEPVTGELSRQ
jgi:hypothetical protein